MSGIFIFTLTTKQDSFNKGDSVFSDDGDVIGRVLSKLKVNIKANNIFYSYDVESTKSTYTQIKNGAKNYIMYNIMTCLFVQCTIQMNEHISF